MYLLQAILSFSVEKAISIVSISRWNAKWAGALAIFWGITLAMPGDLFERIERYRLFNEFFPDWVRGVFFFVFGALVLLPVPQAIQRHAHWLLCALWLGMAVLSLISSLEAPALLVASLCFYVSMTHAGKFWSMPHFAAVNA